MYCIRFPKTSTQGLKVTLHLPIAGDLIKCTGHKYFFSGHKTVLAKTGNNDTKILDSSEY